VRIFVAIRSPIALTSVVRRTRAGLVPAWHSGRYLSGEEDRPDLAHGRVRVWGQDFAVLTSTASVSTWTAGFTGLCGGLPQLVEHEVHVGQKASPQTCDASVRSPWAGATDRTRSALIGFLLIHRSYLVGSFVAGAGVVVCGRRHHTSPKSCLLEDRGLGEHETSATNPVRVPLSLVSAAPRQFLPAVRQPSLDTVRLT